MKAFLNMNVFSFVQKITYRINRYVKQVIIIIEQLPKRLLAKFVVNIIGSYMIKLCEKKTHGPEVKPHILILRNKFYSKGSEQLSTEVMHLDNTLKTSGLATFEVLTYDDDLHISPLCDLQLIAKCRDVRPDAIVLSSWSSASRHPSIHSLNFIRDRLDIPVAAIWWDTCSKHFWEGVKVYIECFDVHVIVDNPTLQYIDKENPFYNRVLSLWPPQDGDLFKPGSKRDIPVSFLGQTSAYRSYRTEVIDYLKKKNIRGCFSTSDRGEQVTHSTYADLMGRSKISLNFSYSVDCHQLKSRVMEVMLSGALLLESSNKQINSLFEPMRDYVPFNSKEDLVEKICYYLEHEEEMSIIAAQGRAAVLKHYSSTRFWQLILNKLQLIKLE